MGGFGGLCYTVVGFMKVLLASLGYDVHLYSVSGFSRLSQPYDGYRKPPYHQRELVLDGYERLPDIRGDPA